GRKVAETTTTPPEPFNQGKKPKQTMTLSPVNRFVFVGVCILGMFSLGQVGCSLFVPKKDRTQFYVLRAAKAEGRRYSASRTDAVDVRVGPGNVASYLDSLS